MKIHPVGTEFYHADRQTDMTKLIVAFSNFPNAARADVLSGGGTAVRSTAGLTAPTVSCLLQIQRLRL